MHARTLKRGFKKQVPKPKNQNLHRMQTSTSRKHFWSVTRSLTLSMWWTKINLILVCEVERAAVLPARSHTLGYDAADTDREYLTWPFPQHLTHPPLLLISWGSTNEVIEVQLTVQYTILAP